MKRTLASLLTIVALTACASPLAKETTQPARAGAAKKAGEIHSAKSDLQGNAVPIYGKHSYICCPEIHRPTPTWDASQRIRLRWAPMFFVRTLDPTPHPILLMVSLTGPFATVEALKKATSTGSKPAGVRTINAPPVSANDKRVEALFSQLDLPADLPPGFYNVAMRTVEGGYSSDADAVVVVAPGSASPPLSARLR